MNIKPEIVYNHKSNPGPDRMRADITLAAEKLGFQPMTSLESGLRKTIQFDPKLSQMAKQAGLTF